MNDLDMFLFEMATVYTGVNVPIKIFVSYDEKRIGNQYFKVINAKRFESATKMARISFEEPKYIIHSKNYGKDIWFLDSHERRLLVSILETKQKNGLTYGEEAIIQYNSECLGINRDNQYDMTAEQLRDLHGLPLNTPMPDYTLLPQK